MLRALMLLAASTLALTPADASASAEKKRVYAVEKQFSQLDQKRVTLEFIAPKSPHDVRGRTEFDDYIQWAYTDDLRGRVKPLIDSARSNAKEASKPGAALDQAEQLLNGANVRATEISKYWTQSDAIFWRNRWKLFAETNGLPPGVPDPELENREKIVLDHLAKGDFSGAASESAGIGTRLQAAIGDATNELLHQKKGADVKFTARSTPCPGTDGPRRNASITKAASPEEYYPPASRRRDEQGDVVVRARVASTGCATGFAVMVGSGYPELDAAAIKVAEASRYAAAMDASGQTVDANVTFKVRFTIRP